MEKSVSTVTVNYNHKHFPKLCVEAVEASQADFLIQIIFVDNASSDPISVNFLKQAATESRINLVESKMNVGFAGGNNLGAKVATGKYILILNPDTAVTKDAIAKMVDYMETHPEVGVLGPKLVYSDGQIQESCRRDMNFLDLIVKRTFLKSLPYFKEREAKFLMKDFNHNQTQEVDLLTGACMMLPRQFYEEIGGFVDRYFLFMEDFDLCKETRQHGKKVVYYPEAIVDHYHKRLSGGNFLSILFKKVFWLHVSSAFKYFVKWS